MMAKKITDVEIYIGANLEVPEIIETYSAKINNYGVFSLTICSRTKMYNDFDNLDFTKNNYFITAFVETESIVLPIQFNAIPYMPVSQITADNFDKDNIKEIQNIRSIAIY